MTFRRTLHAVNALFTSWGLSRDDWMLFLHGATKLQGYKIPYRRKNHFHILMPVRSVPWRVTRRSIDEIVVPPDGSSYFRSHARFMRITGYDFHLIVTTDAFFRAFRKRYSKRYPLGKATIRITKPEGSLRYNHRYYHKRWRQLSPEMLHRRLEYYVHFRDAARKRGDRVLYRLAATLLERYYPVESTTAVRRRTAGVLHGKGVYGKKPIRGAVYLLGSPDRSPRFRSGRVVVAPFVGPKQLALIRQSAAVVTDEGGILSHAAVYCREFRIPCVIGTKHATEALKDGDRVEVDATKGIVRKL